MTPIESLLASGSKIWTDSIEPELLRRDRGWGITGATSNPLIVADLIASGRFDREVEEALHHGKDDAEIAWSLTDLLVRYAQEMFLPVWEQTSGNDGYVSFELDPLLEDPEANLPQDERVEQYVELGRRWAEGHKNRMIKVPATPAGVEAMQRLVAAGVKINVTLMFTPRQYTLARDAVWRGARGRARLGDFKAVYSIFVSRIDTYTAKVYPQLSPAAQGTVGILIAKRIWAENQAFWAQRPLRLRQEIVLASMGTKRREEPPWKYVEALAGGDIQTNPPATNEAVARSGRTFTRQISHLPPDEVIREIDGLVDMERLEEDLLREGIAKFVEPQRRLLATVAEKRLTLAAR